MRINLKYATGLGLVALLAAGCGEKSSPPAPQGSSDIEGYRDWPLRRQTVAGTLGHGASRIYGNDVVTNYLAKVGLDPATLRYPVGSIIVNDVFREDGTLEYVAIMRKPEEIPAGATAYGGWVWAQRKTSTAVDKFKTAEECLACHNGANSEKFKDYVFVFPQCGGSASCVQ